MSAVLLVGGEKTVIITDKKKMMYGPLKPENITPFVRQSN